MKRPSGVDVDQSKSANAHEHLIELGVDACADVPAQIAPNGTPVGDVPVIVRRGNSAIVRERIRPRSGRVDRSDSNSRGLMQEKSKKVGVRTRKIAHSSSSFSRPVMSVASDQNANDQECITTCVEPLPSVQGFPSKHKQGVARLEFLRLVARRQVLRFGFADPAP